MSESKTVGKVVAKFICQFGFTNTDSDRIWFHDFCHVLTAELGSQHVITTDGKNWGQQPTHKSEILAAIYQAVLLDEDKIYPYEKDLHQGADSVTSRKVLNFLVPAAMRFLGRGDVDITKHVSLAEMYEHFQLAGHLSRLLEERFGEKIGSVAREQIANISFADLNEMLAIARGKVIEIGVFIDR